MFDRLGSPVTTYMSIDTALPWLQLYWRPDCTTYSLQAIGLIYDKPTCLLDVWLQPSEREIFRGPCCLPHKCQAFMAPVSLSLKAAEFTSPDLHGLSITYLEVRL